MTIFIQHTDNKFYEIGGAVPSHEILGYPEHDHVFRADSSTECRDFPVGSMVYFQGIGWTEVLKEYDDRSKECALIGKCNFDYKCSGRIFKKIGQQPKQVDDDGIEIIPTTKNESGIKHDGGKLRWSLLPIAPLREVVKVYMFGADKYGEGNWQKLDNPKVRYYDAAMRHFLAWKDGEMTDKESGLFHLAHTIWNIITIFWFELREDKNGKE